MMLEGCGGEVMLWGCMGVSSVGDLAVIDGIMTQYLYIDIFKENLQQNTDKLCIQAYKFHQDNDPKHTILNTRL